jgi:hypothetical protein
LTAPFTRSSGWSIASVGPERLQARFAPEGVPAWLAKIERIAPRSAGSPREVAADKAGKLQRRRELRGSA